MEHRPAAGRLRHPRHWRSRADHAGRVPGPVHLLEHPGVPRPDPLDAPLQHRPPRPAAAAVRRAEADRADAALALLRDRGRPRTTGRDTERAHAWALQNATAITQSFTAYAFPDEQFPERMRYRDRAMAANTAWWLRHEGGRILLASNNGHVAYTSDNPDEFPEPTGAFLRARLGPDYVNIGLTFNQGTVNALPDFTSQQPREYTVAPAPKGYNEHTLDKLRYRDFSIDLRTAPPAARTWLAAARPTRSYGLYWSTDDPATALGRSYDILIHLHQVEAAHILQ